MRKPWILFLFILFVALIAKPCFSEEDREAPVDGWEWESWLCEPCHKEKVGLRAFLRDDFWPPRLNETGEKEQ